MNARDRVKAQLRASQTELRRLEQADAARRLAKAREDKGFAEAERALAKANIALASARARGESTSKLETGLKKAQAAYDSALKRLGADVSVHYRCDKCRDIGFDKDGEPCDCVKAQFIDMLKAECGSAAPATSPLSPLRTTALCKWTALNRTLSSSCTT